MQKLPPYGRTIDQTQDTIWVFAGWQSQVYPYVRHYSRNTIGIFLWEDPQNYRWPVANRDVIVFCWLAYNDEYMERLAYTLGLNGANEVAVYSIPTHEQIIYTRS